MPQFIDKIIQKLKATPETEWKTQAFVFANRRASIFFKERLITQTENTVWLPTFYTFESFLSQLTGLHILDETNLLFELYPVYHEFFPDDSFEIFWNWGKIILNDFNEIDRYNRNVDDVLSNLEALREIDIQVESWEMEDRTSYKSRYIWFWKSLKPLYKKFRKTLFDKKIAYKGLALKNALFDKQKIISQPYKKIWFCGFHGFTDGEEAFIQLLGEKAEVIFDVDEWYLNNTHIAGKWFQKSSFLRKNEEIPAKMQEKKDIYIIGTPQKLSQVKAIPLLWEKYGLLENNSVVVLADTSLLFPLLYAIPDEVKHVNITLGYPFSFSPAFSFINLILQNARESLSESIETKDVLKTLRHPYTIHFEPNILDFVGKLSENYPGKIHYSTLLQELPDTVHILFPIFTIKNSTAQFKNILFYLRDFVRKDNFSGLEEEFIFAAYTLFNRLEDIAIKYNADWTLQEFRLLFQEISKSYPIPFSGEPIQGLQCMGFLETRCLDFETVIIPCMNAKTIPSESSQNTLIPYDLRKRYGLSLPEDHESEHSYYFYRLIQYAKKIFLLYDGEEIPDEKSPLIAQLEAQWKPLYPTNWHQYYWSPEIKQQINKNIYIEKHSIWEHLVKISQTGFSATKIQTYLQCPLKFGFQLLDFKQTDEKTNDLDDADFGVLFHKLVEKIYTPLLKHPEFHTLSEEKIVALCQRKYKIKDGNFWQTFITQTFAEIFENRTLDGKNMLFARVLEEQLKHLIRSDLQKSKNTPFNVNRLEKKWSCTLSLKTGIIREVVCKGFIDRVDEDEHCVRAIDYKTGNIQSLHYPELDILFSNESPKEAFQLMFYAWLLYQNGKTPPIQAAIYHVRQHQYLHVKSDGAIFSMYESDFRKFEKGLKMIIEEILNPNKLLEQTQNKKNCLHCIYKNVCSR